MPFIPCRLIAKDPDLRYHSDVMIRDLVETNFFGLNRSLLTLLQFVTLDDIADVYFPLVLEKPYLCAFFFPILIFISIGLMNLVTAAWMLKLCVFLFSKNTLVLAGVTIVLKSNPRLLWSKMRLGRKRSVSRDTRDLATATGKAANNLDGFSTGISRASSRAKFQPTRPCRRLLLKPKKKSKS